MRILLTNQHLDQRPGSDAFVRDLVRGLHEMMAAGAPAPLKVGSAGGLVAARLAALMGAREPESGVKG